MCLKRMTEDKCLGMSVEKNEWTNVPDEDEEKGWLWLRNHPFL